MFDLALDSKLRGSDLVSLRIGDIVTSGQVRWQACGKHDVCWAPSGTALFIDVTAPPSGLLDSWLQSMELLRDISLVRDYTVAKWTTLLG